MKWVLPEMSLIAFFFMNKGELAVDASPKEVFENPKNERLKEFLNKVLNH